LDEVVHKKPFTMLVTRGVLMHESSEQEPIARWLHADVMAVGPELPVADGVVVNSDAANFELLEFFVGHVSIPPWSNNEEAGVA
jgi:hypothetical protein